MTVYRNKAASLLFCDVCREHVDPMKVPSPFWLIEWKTRHKSMACIAKPHVEQLNFLDYLDHMFEEVWKETRFASKEYKDELKDRHRARFYRDAS